MSFSNNFFSLFYEGIFISLTKTSFDFRSEATSNFDEYEDSLSALLSSYFCFLETLSGVFYLIWPVVSEIPLLLSNLETLLFSLIAAETFLFAIVLGAFEDKNASDPFGTVFGNFNV